MAENVERVEDTIRRCIREEMRNARVQDDSLLNRTRGQIQSAASSAARELPRERPGPKRANSVPGHPWRPQLKKEKGESRAPAIS